MNENEPSVKIHKWREKSQVRKNSQMKKKFTNEEPYTSKIKEKIKRKITFVRRWSVTVALSKRIIEFWKSDFKKKKQL